MYSFGNNDRKTVSILRKRVLIFKKFWRRFVAQAYPGKVVKPFKKIPNGFDASEKRSTWGVEIPPRWLYKG